METIAENRFTVTEKIFREGTAQLMRDELGSLMKKVIIALCLIWLALAAFAVYSHTSIVMPLIELVVVVAIILWMVYFSPRQRIKKSWQTLKDRSGDDMTRATMFYEDRLEVTTGGRELIVNYEDVVRTLQTPHLLILIDKDKHGIMAALDGFTKGDKDTVLAAVDKWKEV